MIPEPVNIVVPTWERADLARALGYRRRRKPWTGRVYEAAVAANRPAGHREPTHRAGRR